MPASSTSRIRCIEPRQTVVCGGWAWGVLYTAPGRRNRLMKRSEDPNRHAPSRPVLLGAALLASVSIAAAAAVATMASAGRQVAGDAPARASKTAVHDGRALR